MKTYEVEFKATTYRQVVVDAKNRDEAEEKAWEELQHDTEITAAWVESAEVHTLTAEDDSEANQTWMNANGKVED